ncbi:hypothetical protein [Nocardioides sp.]|uniref:hypothetical protein n=1 Tax=Nocardioides sp. TaxID=35761 RepID=UPI0035B2C416
MSENEKPGDETQPVRPQDPSDGPAAPSTPAPAAPAPEAGAPGAAAPVAAAPPAAAAGPGWGRFRRWRSQQRGDRTFSLGALIASALAGIIVGGVGTAVFHAATDDHDRGGWVERRGPMGRDGFDDDDRGPMFGGPRGVPGQLQPTTPPEDEDSGSSS